MKKPSLVVAELKRIAAENGGILQPALVVEAARPKASPLHSRFEWSDTKAAQEYRLLQARQLIRVTVDVLPGGSDTEERIWVSLPADRVETGGGYRPLVTVLSDSELRKQLLAGALEEMEYFTQKYQRLEELAGVFAAIRKVKGPAKARGRGK